MLLSDGSEGPYGTGWGIDAEDYCSDPDIQVQPHDDDPQIPPVDTPILAADNRVEIRYPDGRTVVHSSKEWLPPALFAARQPPVWAVITTPIVAPTFPSCAQRNRVHEWIGGALYYPSAPPKSKKTGKEQ